MGHDHQPAAVAAPPNAAVRHVDPSQSVYHLPAPTSGQQHDTAAARLPRVTSPPHAMSMSQPPLLPPLQQQQQQQNHPHYDGAHLHMPAQTAQAQQQPPPYASGQPMNAYSMPPQQHHAHPPPYQPQQHPFTYQNGGMHQPPPMPSSMMVNGNGTMRYALPPQMAPGNMGARTANAKQIKRRTKTGCLTCRKRRIKCDEGHPTCRNCQKSKRDCLGYDPIFKQQPGPAAIQPAPSAATGSSTKSVSPSLPSNNPYSPAQSYANPASGFIASPRQPHADNTFEFAPSLDPALSPSEQSFAMQQSLGPPLQSARKASSVTMAQLFSLNDVEPTWQKREAPPPDFPLSEIEQFYRFHYAQGLDKLFESTWYTTHGWSHMQHDAALLDFVGQCHKRMKASAEDAASVQATASLESRLVWQLSIMPRSAQPSNQAYGAISNPLLSDLLPRIDTVENILTGQFLPMVQIPSPPGVEHQSDPRKHNEMHFWHQLGRIASIHDDSLDPAATRDINDALAAMRGVLGLMENRDVLYSIAIARYVGGRLESYDPQTPLTRTGNVESEVDKLETARAFIASEDERGMTQVIQRVCGMAMRSAVLQRQQ